MTMMRRLLWIFLVGSVALSLVWQEMQGTRMAYRRADLVAQRETLAEHVRRLDGLVRYEEEVALLEDRAVLLGVLLEPADPTRVLVLRPEDPQSARLAFRERLDAANGVTSVYATEGR